MNGMLNAMQCILGLVFFRAGGSKLAGSDQMVDTFARFRYPQWLRIMTGALEVGGAAGMVLGLSRPALVPPAGLALGSVMIGAISTHLHRGDPRQRWLPPLVLLTLTCVVFATRIDQKRGVTA